MARSTAGGASGGIPGGAKIIIAFEFWERFSFYTLLSLLALFLTASTAEGGFGWGDGRALLLLGIYTGLMFGLPVLGGLVADRFLGHQAAIVTGGALLAAAQLLLTVAAFVPAAGGETGHALRSFTAPLGDWPVPAAAWGAGTGEAYRLVSLSFWGAICLMIVGNALVKSTLVVALGDAFQGADSRRERAYAYYYAGINLGGLIAGLAAGTVAQAFGWYIAFAMAGLGMTFALGLYLALRQPAAAAAALGSKSESAAATDMPGKTALRLVVLSALAALLCLYHVGAFQLWGSWMIVLDRDVDRRVGGFLIPTQWFTSLNAAVLITAAPVLGWAWTRLERTGATFNIVLRYALALMLGAVALVVFAYGTKPGSNWLPAALAIFLMSVGEVVAWTSTYGIVYRLAPPSYVATAMGAYYAVTLGVGGYAAGWAATFSQQIGYLGLFLTLGGITLAGAIAAVIASGPLTRAAAEIGEPLSPPTSAGSA